jgi:hypothetical protein
VRTKNLNVFAGLCFCVSKSFDPFKGERLQLMGKSHISLCWLCDGW